MKLSIDFGGSYTKAVLVEQELYYSFPSTEITDDLANAVTYFRDFDIDSIIATGGKSQFLGSHFKSIPIYIINELDAVGSYLHKIDVDRGLVVAVGTGTPAIYYDNGKCIHVGGTSIGGGTIRGLAHNLLGISIDQLEELASKGNLRNINLSVGDIIGSGIGNLPAEATASSFGKKGAAREDIAAGILHLVAESVGALVSQIALRKDLKEIYFVGGAINSDLFKEGLRFRLDLYDLTPKFQEHPEFCVAYGAYLLHNKLTK